MKKKSLSGFSLVELLVAMTIFFIVVSATFIPYSYYQQKQYVKNATKEVAQLLYEARGLAINGQANSLGNLSLGVYFDAIGDKNTVSVFSYPYTFTGSQIVPATTTEIKLIKKITLEGGVQVDAIGGNRKALFFFQSITGNPKFFYWDAGGAKQEFTGDILPIILSYKGATTVNFQKQLQYYTYTNIIDY